MKVKVKQFVRTGLYFFLRNRYLRRLFAYYLYRRLISQSEAVIALLRKDKLDESYWMGKLRHYAHILDKGLYRCDFSKGHGTKAYGIAKRALSHITSREALRDPSVEWAARKIKQYEASQSGRLHEFRCQNIETSCKYEDLIDAIMTRRSVRHYIDKPVENEAIERIINVLDWSPTSCNRQPARVYATNNPTIVRQCVQQHVGAACFTDIYAPLFLVFCADSRVYEMPMEVAMPHVDVALGVQNCLLAAHTLGISLTLLTCTYLVDQQDRELRRIFEIPQHFQIIVSAVGGYTNSGVEVPARKNKELFIIN